jgi:Protein of unknown function (DUF3047)
MKSKRIKLIAVLLILLMLLSTIAHSDLSEIRLSFLDLSEWKEKSFKGHTVYSLAKNDDGITVLQAVATKSASSLFKKIVVNSSEMPIIKWSWKVKQVIPTDNPYRKDVDDFAGRVMVIFPGTFFWRFIRLGRQITTW